MPVLRIVAAGGADADMSARDELREWIVSRAKNDADAKAGGALVAKFVADAVRADRKKMLPQVQETPSDFTRMLDTFFNRRPVR